MGMPRFSRGSVASADSLNLMAGELDRQSLACKVRFTSASSAAPNTDYIINWSTEDYDTYGGGMWDPVAPSYIVIRESGSYLLKAQLRIPAVSGGEAAGKILVNSTDVTSNDPAAGPKTSDKRPNSTSGEGVTLNLVTIEPLQPGDRIYTNIWHSNSATIQVLQQNFGGSYLSVSRVAPLA